MRVSASADATARDRCRVFERMRFIGSAAMTGRTPTDMNHVDQAAG
jgi:hypothetical protein